MFNGVYIIIGNHFWDVDEVKKLDVTNKSDHKLQGAR